MKPFLTQKLVNSEQGVKHLAEWLLSMDCVKYTEIKDILVVRVPNVPTAFSCTLNHNKKYHLCSCNAKKKPCSHLVAALVKSGYSTSVEDVMKMRKLKFKNITYGKRAQSSKKKPLKDYYFNPAIPEEKKLKCAKKQGMQQPIVSDESKTSVLHNTNNTVKSGSPHSQDKSSIVEFFNHAKQSTPSSKLDDTLDDLSFIAEECATSICLYKNNKFSKQKRTPPSSLKYLKNLEDGKVYVIEHTQYFGKLAFCCVGLNTIVVKTTIAPQKELIKYAAKLSRSCRTKIDDFILIKFVHTKEILEINNQREMFLNPSDTLFEQSVKFTVCCLEPFTSSECEETISCGICKAIFHNSCVGRCFIVEDEYHCGLCTLSTSGIRWGAGMMDTCPLDAVLQIFLLKCQTDLKLAEKIKETKNSNPNVSGLLKRTLNYAKKERWENLHKDWAKTIGIKGDSLFGSTNSVVWEYCKNGGLLMCKESCTLCEYKNDFKTSSFIVHDAKLSLQEFLHKTFEVGGESQYRCKKCKIGNRIESNFKPLSGNTWFIRIETDTVHYEPEEFFEMQKEIHFGTEIFKLAGFVIFDAQRGDCLK